MRPCYRKLCVYPDNSILDKSSLADSKTLSAHERELIAKNIRTHSIWGLGWVYPHEIDTINIHHASLLAMNRACNTMLAHTIAFKLYHYHIMIDGKFCPPFTLSNNNITITTETVIKGDSKIAEIKAASILAKTARDAHMMLIDKAFPHYSIASHKGYPTKLHQETLARYGHNSVYRQSFRLNY